MLKPVSNRYSVPPLARASCSCLGCPSTQNYSNLMNKRPKIKPNLSSTDKAIELIDWIAIVGIWILTLFQYSSLPETIPMHYNLAGKADGFGNKNQILTLPIVSSVLFIGLTFLNRFPHIFNYPTRINEENAFYYYTNATRMIRILNLIIVTIFGLIIFKTIQNAKGNADGLGSWFLPLTFGLIFIPLAFYLTKTIRTKTDKNTGFNNE